jgi:Xaa-Pro aminopeptidase
MQKQFYQDNRRKMAVHMAEGDVMVFFSGEDVRKTADENYPFFTNRNFLYLTGVKQGQCVLLMQNLDGTVHERLYALKTDPAQEIWTGRRFTAQELTGLSGVEQIEDIENFQRALAAILSSRPVLTLWLCFDGLLPERAFCIERELAAKVGSLYPQVTIKNSYPLVCALRKIKSPEEIEAIRKGMRITSAGIQRLMRVVKPGMAEYELEAEFNQALAAHGQRRTAFPSIIAAGEHIFYLHYAELMERVLDGELVLADVGASYDEYCTDISRVFPSNGIFNARQKQIYQIAYEANRAIMAQVRPGVPFSMPNQICQEVCFDGLKAIGILDNFVDIRKYVWHGVTHHIGLDTHDVGGYEEPMAENMVFTVDAGIYVREWGIGLRIEDNVLVTADGCENLSADIPATIEAIQDMMAGQPA